VIVLSRWDEVVAASSSPEIFGQYRIGAPSSEFSSHAMAACDDDEHRMKRRAARVLVTRRRIARAAACAGEGAGPIEVMLDLLGLPSEKARQFAEWFGNAEGDPARVLSADDLRREAARREEGAAYLQGEILERMREPRDDALSEWIAALAGNDPHEVVEYLVQETSFLFFAGSLPVEHAIASVRAAPGRDVEETLRLHPPVPALYRVRRDGGEVVKLDWAAANCDPARPEGRHLSFGHGLHVCLGAALARAQLEVFAISDDLSH